MIERLFNDDYVQENHIDDLYLTVKNIKAIMNMLNA